MRLVRPRSDLQGKTFGKLIVLGWKHNEFGKVVWECECTCGTLKNVRTDALTTGNTVSCGRASCKRDLNEPSVYGIGCFGVGPYTSHNTEGKLTKEYNLWSGIMTRCYNPKYHTEKPTYLKSEVDPRFHCFQDFALWCQSQHGFREASWHLDKDILQKGNKTYSPDVCVFVPAEINSLLTKANANRGDFPIGVSWCEGKEKFMACLRKNNKTKHIGYFKTSTEAFLAYKREKELYIKEVAEKYSKIIDKRVFDALLKYEVDITD